MAIENIHYVYDHARFYRKTLRLVKNQFFKQLQKNQQKETTKRSSSRTCEKTLSKL